MLRHMVFTPPARMPEKIKANQKGTPAIMATITEVTNATRAAHFRNVGAAPGWGRVWVSNVG